METDNILQLRKDALTKEDGETAVGTLLASAPDRDIDLGNGCLVKFVLCPACLTTLKSKITGW